MSAAAELTCELVFALVSPNVTSRPELHERLRVIAEAHAVLERLAARERLSRRARVARLGGEPPSAMRATC